ARVDRHRERLDERCPQAALLRDELGVLDSDRCGSAERAQRLLVVGRERAAVLVHRLKDADDAPVLAGHGKGEEAPGAIAAAPIGFGIEPRIVVRVRDVDRLAARRDRARDPYTDWLPDLTRAGAARDLGPDPVPAAVAVEDGRADW